MRLSFSVVCSALVLVTTNFSIVAFRFTRLLNKKYSTPLFDKRSWENGPFDKILNFENVQSDSNLELLNANCSIVHVELNDLRAQWIDYCIDNRIPEQMDSFKLSSLIGNLVTEKARVDIVTEESNIPIENEIFITESQLRQLWNDKSSIPMGKPTEMFNEMEALLLLKDDDDIEFIDNFSGFSIETKPSSNKETLDLTKLTSDHSDQRVDYVTLQV
jgi:hypothetical protein